MLPSSMSNNHTGDRESNSSDTYAKIWKLNVGVGILFAVISVLLLADAIVRDAGQAPIYSVLWLRNEKSFVVDVREVDGSASVAYLPFVFTALAAIDHLLVSTVLRPSYERHLDLGQNPFRWAEYSVSASVMNVLIAILSGVLEVHLLMCIGVLTATCMIFGWLGEVVKDVDLQRIIFWLGCLPFLGAWAVIWSAFISGASRAESSPPNFVYAIVISLFILECAFGVNQIVPRKTFIRREVTYIILSPTAKLLLAGLTYGGVRSLPSS